jgi:anti-sigma-K factor RskA
MNEQRQEQASSYALGVLPESERAEFEQALARDPELQQLVRELSDALGEAARSLPASTPPPALKARILQEIATAPPARQPATKIVSFPTWIGWAAAACLALASGWLWLERAESTRQRSQLERTIATMQEEATSLRAREQTLVADADKLQQRATTLEKTLSGLRGELAAAQNAANVANLQVARLSSLVSDQPQAMAVSLWNERTQQGVLLVENLTLPPPGKTYQFWVIDPATATPISAGIFATDSAGRGRIIFRPTINVRTAAKFAISVEAAGGSTKAGPEGPVVMIGDTTTL